jgi:protein-S-isoprenylcysteine O-methyltransferase Ste14
MISWINFGILVLASVLFLLFYVRSASPAGQEKVTGPRAYPRCYRLRVVAIVFEFILTANFILYYFFPLNTPLPRYFPWPWWISLLIALFIGIPATLLMVVGLRDAGEEAARPRKDHVMYGGIYNRLRHPQAVGEVFLFPVMAIFLQSPFLTLFSFIYFPILIIMCYAEEQDLLLRYGDAYAEYCKVTGAFWPKRK